MIPQTITIQLSADIPRLFGFCHTHAVRVLITKKKF